MIGAPSEREEPAELPASGFSLAGYWTTYVAVLLTVLLVDVFTSAGRYADLDTYVYYLDALVHYPAGGSTYFEGLSNLFMLAAYAVTRSVLSAVVLAHYALGIIFVAALLVTFPPRRSSWPALLFTVAMLGPLLAFVTLRATPAYFLVAIGVRFALERRRMAWVCLVVATFFHVSSLLAALPMVLLYFERNLPAMLRSDRSRRFYLLLTLAIIAFGAVLPHVSTAINGAIEAIPVISKYDVYTNVTNNETQIGHYVFLVFVSLLTLGFITVQRGVSARLNVYVLMSFALYVIMFFSASPVAAFRQAPFWIMPMIAAIPWDRMGVNRATASVFVLGCAGLFAFQFGQVYL